MPALATSLRPATLAGVAPALWSIAALHGLNDLFQAVLPAIYPLLQSRYALSYTQIGLISLVFHLVGSLCQPLVGWCTDRTPRPWLLPWAMLCMAGAMLWLARAEGLVDFLLVAGVIGLGSSIFHPEGSRVARRSCAQRPGLAQSLFQLGGNIGSAAAPLLLASVLVVSLAHLALWLAGLALAGAWLLRRLQQASLSAAPLAAVALSPLGALPRSRKVRVLVLLTLLVLSKYLYLACIANFYSFFLLERFALSIQQAQLYLFVFLLAITLGTLAGGPLVDRLGRRRVIAWSILGACPFSLLLPYASLPLALGLSMLIGLIIASAFAAILVMAQDLLPGRTGLVAGAFFGLTFGISGIAAAGLGVLADQWGIIRTFNSASYLPLLGILACWLPNDRAEKT